jgi:glutamyl-tRNA synthetase
LDLTYFNEFQRHERLLSLRKFWKMEKVRVRFAPSPTGPLHMGGVRTALFNYLFARHHGGDFILRIEDTDQTRYVDGAENYIMESLSWCGIHFDEGIREGGNYGPYRQSDRKELYIRYAQQLVDEGKAYLAFDSAEELEKLRAEFESKGETFTYNNSNREKLDNSIRLSENEVKERLAAGMQYVIRFKMPVNREVVMQDIIRGEVRVNTDTLDDKVLFKSDGMPTYHLANIVDDHLMEITHVIRGEEWLPSLPLHVLLYEAFGWKVKQFAHLPLLLKPTGKGKLSKRDGDQLGFPVFPIQWNSPEGEIYSGYRESGYLPEAFVNLLALLGWNPGTEQELFTMDELIQLFSLERVGKAGSRFDPEKAKWFNHQWIQRTDIQILAAEFAKHPMVIEHGRADISIPRLVELLRERVEFVHQLWDESSFFFIAPEKYDESTVKKRWKESSGHQMLEIAELLDQCSSFDPETTEPLIKNWIEEKQSGMGNIMNALRLLLVGKSSGPHIFDIFDVLGKEESLKRIRQGAERLG